MKKNVISRALTVIVTAGVLSLTACGSRQGTVKIGVPDDGTNQSRAIKLLETAGFIEVNPAAGYTPELKDVTKYIYNIEIVPTAANTLTSTLADFGASTINGTYAIPYGLIPSQDALLIEKQDESGENPYVNIIAARTAEQDNETYRTIVEAYQTQLVAEFILEAYKEAFFPAFAYAPEYEVDSSFVEEIRNYQSGKEGKTVVRVGVCGASNDQWLAVQKVLDEQDAGIYIELVAFDAYNLPNEALHNGEIDLNAFQHKAYLYNDVSANGYEVTAIADTLIAPLSLYSQKADSVEALKELAGLKE